MRPRSCWIVVVSAVLVLVACNSDRRSSTPVSPVEVPQLPPVELAGVWEGTVELDVIEASDGGSTSNCLVRALERRFSGTRPVTLMVSNSGKITFDAIPGYFGTCRGAMEWLSPDDMSCDMERPFALECADGTTASVDYPAWAEFTYYGTSTFEVVSRGENQIALIYGDEFSVETASSERTYWAEFRFELSR